MSRGGVRRGAGRPKGAQSKLSLETREVFRVLLEANAERLQDALDAVAKKNPARWIELVLQLAEYCVPKLARSEVTGAGGQPLAPPAINITFPDGGPGTPMPNDPNEAARVYIEMMGAPGPARAADASNRGFRIEDGVEVSS